MSVAKIMFNIVYKMERFSDSCSPKSNAFLTSDGDDKVAIVSQGQEIVPYELCLTTCVSEFPFM